jgi:hypothetical protein
MTDLPGPASGPPPPPESVPTPTPTPTPAATPTPREPGSDGPDWTDQVTDLIVDTVDTVRSKTTGPLLGFARGSVYAVVIAVIAVPVVVLLLAGLVRLVNWALPGDVWYAYLLLGIVFVLAGVVSWTKRPSTSS